MLAVALALQCLLTLGGSQLCEQEACSSLFPSNELPTLSPVGRSFFSSDPNRSAAWFLRYTHSEVHVVAGAEAVGWQESQDAAAVRVMGPSGTAELLYFVRAPDWQGPRNTSMHDFVRAAKLSWDSVMERRQQYNPWVDYHDGFRSESLRFDHLEKDHHQIQRYGPVRRAYVPNTTFTAEWLDITGEDDKDLSPEYAEFIWYADPDACRDKSFADPDPPCVHWKATLGVLDAAAARDFAIKSLGGFWVEGPYPWPPKPECIAAQWVRLPNAGDFEFHFVENPVYKATLHNISEFEEYQKDFVFTRGQEGCINSFLLNSLILKAESLDPFAQRLDELAAPYFAFQLEVNLFALLFSFPGNEGVIMQIQSAHLSHVTPVPVHFCG